MTNGALTGLARYRAELVDEVKLACGTFGAVSVMFRHAVAAQRGLGRAEEKAISVLDRFGRLSPSGLARRLRVSPPAVTAVLNRLARKRIIRRLPSPSDRRRVLVELDSSRANDLLSTFAEFTGTLNELVDRYSDDQLETILEFLRELTRRQRGAMAWAGR